MSDHNPAHLGSQALTAALGHTCSRIEKIGRQCRQTPAEISIRRINDHRPSNTERRGSIDEAIRRSKEEIAYDTDVTATPFDGNRDDPACSIQDHEYGIDGDVARITSTPSHTRRNTPIREEHQVLRFYLNAFQSNIMRLNVDPRPGRIAQSVRNYLRIPNDEPTPTDQDLTPTVPADI